MPQMPRRESTCTAVGTLPLLKAGHRVGHGNTIIMEACEYYNSFLSLHPTVAVVLNVEADHLDFFSGIEEIIESFKTFAHKLPEDGILIIHKDMDCYNRIVEGLPANIITFGLSEGCDYSATDITYDAAGCASYTLKILGSEITRITLHVNGEHNVINSLSAIAAADLLGIDRSAITAGLASFHGAKRRFEKKGTWNGVTIVDDYAHHPTEIKATLKAAQKTEHNKLWCVFQPHTYSRTKALLPEFAEALHTADHVV